ncbi:sensor histidine kinase [Streptomyces sp. NPDC059477]|uniref:sensor histidine kinase n=1 Tax=Streptomyces sp. NPDC059477 TaxID=3346847 RepID=UPI0036931B4C
MSDRPTASDRLTVADRLTGSNRPTVSVRGPRLSLDHVSHLVFLLVVGAGLVRAARFALPLCWYIVAFSALLALVYAGGPGLLRRFGRHGWVPLLVLLWSGLLYIAPSILTPAYVWCGVPLACAALRVLGPRRATAAVAVITLVIVVALLRSDTLFSSELVVIPVAAVWGTVALYRTQQRDAALRQRLVDELRATRDVVARQQRRAGVQAERTRIARDLHDTLAQDLSGGLMLLQAAERDWDARPDVARTRVRAVADGLDANLAETRRILRDLTAAVVDAPGLDDALRELCARAGEDGTAAQVRFHSLGEPRPVLDERAATALFRVAQSTLANVREHADALHATVTLHHGPDRLALEVRDDGVGFDPADVRRAVPAPGHGLGLPTAHARLRECGGTLDITSAPGRGTVIRASVSVRPRTRPPVAEATA